MVENASNLQLSPGKRILILGPSGCGKSSLLKKIAGFDPPFPVDFSSAESAALLLQNPFHQIIMQYVRDELRFPLKNAGINGEEAQGRIAEVTGMLGIAHLTEREISSLSFGETQLLMIAATFLTPADTYLLDEPASHLDPPLIRRCNALVRHFSREGKCIVSTSQIADEYVNSDEIWLMEQGRILRSLSRSEFTEAHQNLGIVTEKTLIEKRLRELKGTA